jgi:hypothetical protein
MTNPLTSLVCILAFATACASAAAPVTNAPAAKECADVPAPAAESSNTDPDILALAEAAKTCKFENSSFDWNCPAYKAFTSESDDLFEGLDGNSTILAMLENSDVRMRTLAADKGFVTGRAFFAQKSNAERLIKVIAKEGEPRVLSRLGRFAAFINAEKLGMTEQVMAFTAHGNSQFRDAVASAMLPLQPTAFSLKFTQKLLDDADRSVKRSALLALSGNGRTRASESLCAALKSQLTRTDDLAAEALEAGSTSKCEGMQEATLTEIEKRVKAAQPDTKLGNFQSAVSSVCWGFRTPEALKKRAFDVAVKVAPKISEEWEQRSFIRLFRMCDVKRAKEALTPFLKSSYPDTAKEVKEELARVEEELKSQ